MPVLAGFCRLAGLRRGYTYEWTGTAYQEARLFDVRFTPKADIGHCDWDVRFVPKADIELRLVSR
jgi:hypothetical protein